MAGAHRAGPLKQQNKAHKGGKRRGAAGERGEPREGFGRVPSCLSRFLTGFCFPSLLRQGPREGAEPPAAPRAGQGGPEAPGPAAPPAAQGGGEGLGGGFGGGSEPWCCGWMGVGGGKFPQSRVFVQS